MASSMPRICGFEGVEDGLDAFPGGLGVGDVPAIGLLGSEVDELSPASDELLDFGLFFGGFLGGRRLHLFGEESQDAGIDAVGLGDQAQGPGEIADPFGIDDGDVVAGIEEVGDDLALVAAGGFEDDETIGGIGEQLAGAARCPAVVLARVWVCPEGRRWRSSVALATSIPIQAQVRAIHGDVPFLPMRARAAFGAARLRRLFGLDFQRPATILLCDGVLSTEARSICRRLFRGWLRSQPRNREH